MKLFTRTFCTLLGAALIGSTLVKADDKTSTNAAAAGTNAGAAMKLDDLLPDDTVARGKGFEIKRSQLDQTIVSIRSSVAAQGRTITPEQMPVVEVQCLDRLITVQILNGRATDAEKAKGKEEADKRLDVFQKRGESFQRQLKSFGLTQETLYKNWSQEATFQAVLRDKVTVTDDQVKKFYDENPDRFMQPELVRVSHVLFVTRDPKSDMPISDDEKLAKKKKADDVAKRAQSGEDFSKLIKDYSEDTAAKDDNGEIKFARETQGVPPEFISAAFALQTNQVSDVVTSQIGFHVIKLSEKIPAKKVELSEAAPRIKEYLQNLEVEKMLPKYTEQLKKEAGVVILDEKLKALEDAEAEKVAKGDAGGDMKPPGAAK